MIRLLVVLLIGFLAACDLTPVTQSTVYTPPATPGGRLCMNQCMRSHEFCSQSCDLDRRACYNQVQTQAQHDYDRYARDRFASHAPIDMFPSDFEHPETCNNAKKSCDADCDAPYDQCYKNCGGSLTVTSSCQFLCFE